MRFFARQKRRDLGTDVVLITGGGRGIGRHLAKEFAKQGARKVKLLPAALAFLFNVMQFFIILTYSFCFSNVKILLSAVYFGLDLCANYRLQ